MNENFWRAKWTQDQIRALLLEQFETFWRVDVGIPRTRLADVEQAASLPHAVVISGLRRVGKSTLLAQMARRLGRDQFYYLNFEDERFLGLRVEDTNTVYQLLVELFGERRIFVVDEIQNIAGWEHFVRRFMDMGFKFYITGSNASLLSRELGSRLTGRYVPIELFPFSFVEFLRFRDYTIPDPVRMTTTDKGLLRHHLDEYLRLGGIPEPLKYPDLPLLRILYDDVIYRDIAVRHNIEAINALKELAFYLVSNPASLLSYNKLKQQLGVGSVNTVKNYIEYLENSWLFFTVNVYAYSVKRQQMAPRKIYCIDTGLVNSIGFMFSPNTGKLMENLAFLALRRNTKEIYYYVTPSGYEVDFYLPETRQIFQVAQNIEHPATREREIRALSEALRALNLSHGTILTDANLDPVTENGITIEIRSLAEWLIDL
ncbi:MAG TPA: ATP-binding protein [Anaerolineae bacterium]|nr:ATP-binding protein [Anaerolineae bacterium]HQK14746.1 ATP-binding protein [Anaerolineae bacterium]